MGGLNELNTGQFWKKTYYILHKAGHRLDFKMEHDKNIYILLSFIPAPGLDWSDQDAPAQGAL